MRRSCPSTPSHFANDNAGHGRRGKWGLESKGRPQPSVPVEQVRAMHKDGVGPSAIARELGISRMSVHRAPNAG